MIVLDRQWGETTAEAVVRVAPSLTALRVMREAIMARLGREEQLRRRGAGYWPVPAPARCVRRPEFHARSHPGEIDRRRSVG